MAVPTRVNKNTGREPLGSPVKHMRSKGSGATSGGGRAAGGTENKGSKVSVKRGKGDPKAPSSAPDKRPSGVAKHDGTRAPKRIHR